MQSRVVRGSDQGVAFDALASRLVSRAQEGYSCTMMAYGQTGSGKTHTMFGPPGCLTEASVAAAGAATVPPDWGLFPRTVLTMMQLPGVDAGSVHASAVEVYHEHVFDLLDERNELSIGALKPMGLKVGGKADFGGNGEGKVGSLNGVHPASCTCHRCFKLQEAKKEADLAARRAKAEAARVRASEPRLRSAAAVVLGSSSSGTAITAAGAATSETFTTVGEKLVPLRSAEEVARFARTIEATRTAKGHLLNDRSSRSHCLVKVHLVLRQSERSRSGVSLLFVDLAGSERIKRTGTEGAAMAEALNINSSLSALGRVIKALGGKQGEHVPYRDSTLTMLLRDSFGGKSCTSVVINVAGEAEHAEETVCSLRFGARMSVVRNSPTVVVDSAADTERTTGHVQAALALYREQLAQMEAEGMGGGIVMSAPASEVKSLQENMRKLNEAEREVRRCIAEIAEARSSGAGTSALERQLRTQSERAEIIGGVVGRQQTIEYLWTLPKPAFSRKRNEVKQLESQLTLLLGLSEATSAARRGSSPS